MKITEESHKNHWRKIKIHLPFPSQEKSISSIDSLGMLDHLNLNIYEQDALHAAFENIDSFIESKSGTQKHVKGNKQIQKYDTDCMRQFPV